MKSLRKLASSLAIASACLVGVATASAAVVETTYNGWDIFGTDPHYEVRYGNAATNGDWEVGTNSGSTYIDTSGQLAWTSGVPQSFTLTHSLTTGDLTLSIGSVNLVYDLAANTGYDYLSIMAKADSSTTSTISNLMLNGNPLTNSTLTSTNAKNGVSLTGMTFSDFTITGNVAFTFPGGYSTGSGVEMFIGVAQPQAVPVPAAIWLFGSGLLGMVGIARKKAA